MTDNMHEAQRAIYDGDSVANRDDYPGDRAERVADVQTCYLRGLVFATLAVAEALHGTLGVATVEA